MIPSLRIAGAIAAGALLASPLAAQKHVPDTYAITGAKIFPVSGPVLDKGTIVIRDGVIAAVGGNVTVPADARLIDGTGLTIYPGFIDAYGSLGQPAPPGGGAAAAAGRGAAGAATPAAPAGAPNSNYPIGLQPEMQVVNALVVEAGGFDAAHAAGITAALTGAPAGIFRGQSALINLGGDDVSALIVKSPVAQNIGFARGGGGRGGYPGSLMGAFSALRQELLDAQHYRDVKNAYDRNPRGAHRPGFDASLEALQPVLARQQPVIMQANTEREIIRALDLAREFNLRPIIAGGAEAYKVSARLKSENVPVLLSLSFPRVGAAAAGGGRGGQADPADPEPLRMLRDRLMAPRGPGMLANQGVSFAFESGSDFTNMIANLRKAVAAGLPADQAIKSLTWQPAEVLGVSDRLGSIEAGKIANLTIISGDLFDPASRVTQLFVDGKPMTIPPPTAPSGPGSGRGARPGGDLSGAWTVSVSIDGREQPVTLHIVQYDDEITGVIQGTLGSSEIVEGAINDDGTFSFIANVALKGGTEQAEFNGMVDRKGMHGQLSAEGHKAGIFAGSQAR